MNNKQEDLQRRLTRLMRNLERRVVKAESTEKLLESLAMSYGTTSLERGIDNMKYVFKTNNSSAWQEVRGHSRVQEPNFGYIALAIIAHENEYDRSKMLKEALEGSAEVQSELGEFHSNLGDRLNLLKEAIKYS